MELKVDIKALIPFLSLDVLFWEAVLPRPIVTQNSKPVPPSISDRESIQANTPGCQNKFFIYFHS